MRRLANIITAYIYIFIVKSFTKQSKAEILEGEPINKFGANLVFSSFVLMLLIMIFFYFTILGFSHIVKLAVQ